MAVKSVSELQEITTLNDEDLFMVSKKDGSGNYTSSNKLTYGALKTMMPSGGGSGSGSPFFQLELFTPLSSDFILDSAKFNGSKWEISAHYTAKYDILVVPSSLGNITQEYLLPHGSTAFWRDQQLECYDFLWYSNDTKRCRYFIGTGDQIKFSVPVNGLEDAKPDDLQWQERCIICFDYLKIFYPSSTSGGRSDKVYTDTVFDLSFNNSDFISVGVDAYSIKSHSNEYVDQFQLTYPFEFIKEKIHTRNDLVSDNLSTAIRYVNKGDIISLASYVVPQSQGVPGTYYSKTYDLSSLMEETETSSIVRVKIPDEFSDYISGDFYMNIFRYDDISEALYGKRIAYNICVGTSFNIKNGFLAHIKLVPQIYKAYSLWNLNSMLHKEITYHSAFSTSKAIKNGDKSGVIYFTERTSTSDGDTTWYVDVPIDEQNIRLQFAYLKYDTVNIRPY